MALLYSDCKMKPLLSLLMQRHPRCGLHLRKESGLAAQSLNGISTVEARPLNLVATTLVAVLMTGGFPGSSAGVYPIDDCMPELFRA